MVAFLFRPLVIGLPIALIAGFLILARRQVRRASESYWEELTIETAPPSNVVTRPATRVDASHGTVRKPRLPELAATALADPADEEPTITLDRDALREARVDVGVVTTADGASLWDPLPVTLPTYVDKPAAKRTYRTIELGDPGTWSPGHSAQDSKTAASARTAPATPTPAEPSMDHEAIDETPQAVNG